MFLVCLLSHNAPADTKLINKNYTAVGIRESSIYKHYAGKQAILDEIVKNVGEEIDNLFISLKVPDLDNSLGRYVEMEIEK